ncbi:hypothetical protein [Nocardia paucivorans]|uniref:hypothetical protein n=1 Tax=Nocardia paucivorans TaxID=114259 RepID=UPI00059268B5|nr:hypothetical protein [Nocardia paucivorans]
MRAVSTGIAVAGALIGAGCDSVSGIQDEYADPPPVAEAATEAAAPTTGATDGRPGAASETTELPPVPADAPEVGPVAGMPEAVPALRRFATDLAAGDTTALQDACWTIPPLTLADMYADSAGVLAALSGPGTLADGRITWSDDTYTLTVGTAAVESGYACPRVHPAGTEPTYDTADARHTVRRYLARLVGRPLHPTDREDTYPLVCPATPANWDPQGSGNPVSAPLASEPDALTGITTFADQEISSEQLGSGYIAVRVPVTDASGTTRGRVFTVTETTDGHCIGDVTP